MITRQSLRDHLQSILEPLPWVLAASEGGSAAFGRADQWSDLDLAVTVEDGRVEDLFTAIEDALRLLSPIELRYRIPEPAWHGMSQAFYRLSEAPPSLLLDLCVSTRSRPDTLTERARHGLPVVLFDREGLVQCTAMDPVTWGAKLNARLQTLSLTFPMFQTLVERAVLRGQPLDALGSWHSFTLRPLVELLRIRHAPARFDYGMRYLNLDLPADVHDRLAALAFVSDPAEILARLPEATAWFHMLHADLQQNPPALEPED